METNVGYRRGLSRVRVEVRAATTALRNADVLSSRKSLQVLAFPPTKRYGFKRGRVFPRITISHKILGTIHNMQRLGRRAEADPVEREDQCKLLVLNDQTRCRAEFSEDGRIASRPSVTFDPCVTSSQKEPSAHLPHGIQCSSAGL